MIKKILSQIKPYLRWVIFGLTLFFLVKALKENATEVLKIRIDNQGWLILVGALVVTLMAHIWAGWVWGWILKAFNQPINLVWAIQIYLKTNIAKYLPGNFWHFYGRIWAVSERGATPGVATLSVLLEPILTAADALLICLISSQLIGGNFFPILEVLPLEIRLIICGLSLVMLLILIQPRFLNILIKYAGGLKGKSKSDRLTENNYPADISNNISYKVDRYLLMPLLGEFGFLALRGAGFLLTLVAIKSVNLSEIPLVFSAFCFAWLLGLIVPGAPGGIGVFEATAIALLDGHFPPAILLASVAFYRSIGILAEAIAALGAVIIFGKTSPSHNSK